MLSKLIDCMEYTGCAMVLGSFTLMMSIAVFGSLNY
jgi:hypothetical protein